MILLTHIPLRGISSRACSSTAKFSDGCVAGVASVFGRTWNIITSQLASRRSPQSEYTVSAASIAHHTTGNRANFCGI